MRISAIETSGYHGSVALLTAADDGVQLVNQTALTGDQRTAAALAPALRQLLREADWPPASIELVAVAVGPGSFTGLRIGVTTAKTFAYAAGASIVGVDTLDVLAAQARPSDACLCSIMDAQRQELFAARFQNVGSHWKKVSETSIVAQDSWLAQLRQGECVIGPALRKLAPRLPPGVVSAPDDVWEPTAETVGRVAWHAYQAGHRDDLWKLMPNYYRPSAAEEKRPNI
jgi:tRNA threonylcarbamoyladenosine biosynthesis protein TsaB